MARKHYSPTRRDAYLASEDKRREITERKREGRAAKAETRRRFG